MRNLTDIYVRLSDEDRNKRCKADESESIQNQKSMLINYCIEQGWQIHKIYCDEHVIIGTSGENLVKSRGSALVPFSFLLRDKPKSFKSLKIINERL